MPLRWNTIGPLIFYQRDRTPAAVLLALIPGHLFFAFSRNRRLHVAWAGFVLLVYAVGLAAMSIG